jgi:hypothetical protein
MEKVAGDIVKRIKGNWRETMAKELLDDEDNTARRKQQNRKKKSEVSTLSSIKY